jgi:hypothetical protein
LEHHPIALRRLLPFALRTLQRNRNTSIPINVEGLLFYWRRDNPFTHHRVMKITPRLRLKNIVTHRFSLDEIHEAIATPRRGEGLKICIKPNG